MSEKDTDAERAVSRRDMFKAGVIGTGLAAYSSLGTQEVSADHTTPTEPLITLGDSFELFDSGDDAVIKHVPSGAHFTYNQAQSRWEMDAPLHLTGEDLSGVGAVTTEEVNNAGSPIDQGDILNRLDMSVGSTTTVFEAYTTDNGGTELGTQQTDGVSTSATTILDQPEGGTNWVTLVIVFGDERGSTNRFYEVLNFGVTVSANVIDTQTNGSPAGRAYTRSGSALQLAMASDTYDVVATGFVARRNINASS